MVSIVTVDIRRMARDGFRQCRKSSLSMFLLHRLNQTKNGLTLDQMRPADAWMVHRVQVHAVDARAASSQICSDA